MNYTRFVHAQGLVKSLGIEPQLFPAVPSYRKEVDEFALALGARINPHSGIAKAIGLALSHRNVLNKIVQTLKYDDEWALILEDDIDFFKEFPAHSGIIRELLAYAMKIGKESGFFYLGLCSPECDAKTARYKTITFQTCWGQCTHAYAVKRSEAKTLFQNVITAADHIPVNSMWKYHMDLLYKNYFSQLPLSKRPILVGSNIQMPKEPHRDWFGIVFQNRWLYPSTLDHNIY